MGISETFSFKKASMPEKIEVTEGEKISQLPSALGICSIQPEW
jgi:hypothetical protein